ncbi:MAG: amidohydrolase family protein, partial [Pseudomonadota bacterium]
MSKFRFIDSHVHLFPEPLFHSIWKWFDECAWPVKHKIPADEIIRLLIKLGAERLVVYNYSHKAGVSSSLNEWNYNLAKKYPKLITCATVHPEDDDLLALLRTAFRDYNLYGLKIHCHVNKIAPDDERMFPIYEKVIEYDKILNIHAGTGPPVPSYDFDINEICGVKRFRKVLKRYPDLRCIVPHLGAEEFEEFYDLMREYANLWTDTTMILSGFFPHHINPERLVEFQDRILYGSDTPNIPYDLDTEINYIKKLGLGEE